MSKKAKKVPACTPQSWEEADNAVTEFGEVCRKLTTIEARLNKAVARIQARCLVKTAPLNARAKELVEGLEIYATANRRALTENGATKTVVLTAGRFGWRTNPPSIAYVRGFKVEHVIASVRAVCARLAKSKIRSRRAQAEKLLSFIRTKEEVNKDAMLASKDLARAVQGVRIVEGEESFFLEVMGIKPVEPK